MELVILYSVSLTKPGCAVCAIHPFLPRWSSCYKASQIIDAANVLASPISEVPTVSLIADALVCGFLRFLPAVDAAQKATSASDISSPFVLHL